MARPLEPSALPVRIGRYLNRCVRIDTRSLALFRIVAGALIVADLLLRSRNFSYFYTEHGVVPRSVAMDATPDYAFSFYYLTTSTTLLAALFVLQGLIALQLIVGYRTRAAAVLSFLFVISLDHHNPFVLSYADTLFRLLLFWAIFLPLGERWSIDAVHRDAPPRPHVSTLASAFILSQMVVMYVVNGYHKSTSTLWTSGEATPLIMGLDDMTFLLAGILRQYPALLELGGLTWYYMLLFAWLLIFLQGRARLAFVAMFVIAHLSFALTVRIGAFPWVAITGLLPFLQRQFWDDATRLAHTAGIDTDRLASRLAALERLAASFPAYRLDSERLLAVRAGVYTFVVTVIAVTVVVLVALSLVQFAGVALDDDRDEEFEPDYPEEIETVAASLNIAQPDWSVFAPVPRTTDRYYVFPAKTATGEQLDVYNGGRPLTYDRPYDELQHQYGTYRERFYMNDVRRAGSSGDASRHLAEHLCETWTDEHGDELVQVNMYMVTEDITLETIADPANRERSTWLLYEHGCDGHEPATIDPPAF
ncbi:HTTM domain-containing protein [Natronobeatus ordinarius]|uniref:HTTM domain-containing protein n=1 Tax=Natronobeatus ordinarius TaxID=2963433 RepID=UPI0020CD0012|nr:HTTM domain-containing protein [Natronobeatus ordinarius]